MFMFIYVDTISFLSFLALKGGIFYFHVFSHNIMLIYGNIERAAVYKMCRFYDEIKTVLN